MRKFESTISRSARMLRLRNGSAMIRHLRKVKKSNCIIFGLFLLVCSGYEVITGAGASLKQISLANSNVEDSFAGSASCAKCHRDIYESHIRTAHYRDSRPASREFIKGSFSPGKNKFVYNSWMEVMLEQKKDSLFQTAYMGGVEFKSEPFDVVVGSGRKGQTYLYWDEDMLYQLPVSYYAPLKTWCNSPGFPINFIKFDRIVPAQCLECHSTYIEVKEDRDNISYYDRTRLIYGIDCEKCHGPAADHVNFHTQHPEEKSGKYLVNIKQLGRQQRLDGCALCHSGFRQPVKPAFSFRPGDRLDEHSVAGYSNDSVSTLDVHGNQYGLLTSSKCFRMSQMDCSSCHNVHADEVNSPRLFSQRCIACHQETAHASLQLSSAKKLLLNNNCIDCHMPMLPSQAIILTVAHASAVPDMVRTHRVGIYAEQTKELLKKMKR